MCTVYVDVSYTKVFRQVHSVMNTLQLKYAPCKTNLLSQILTFSWKIWEFKIYVLKLKI